ncbi:hypothetical protein T484DRAFT_1756815 [Baffinella frigidus]|nr:hypothetical protein T484DRAFT_1756815 [Cryptophyta sp. CCMP2293]
MYNQNNKRPAREEYGVQQRDAGAWNPPASHYTQPRTYDLSHSMHLTPGQAQRDAFYLPRARRIHSDEVNQINHVHATHISNERQKRHHSEIDIEERLVNEMFEKIELHRTHDLEKKPDIVYSEASTPDRAGFGMRSMSGGIDYDTAQRCVRSALQNTPGSIDHNLARRCAASAIRMQQLEDSRHHTPAFNSMETSPTTAEMRRNAAHAAFRRMNDHFGYGS